MGFLHRLFGRKTREVWQAETRLMHRLGYVHPPEAVQWISTSACDLSCPHCYSHAGRKQHTELTTDEAQQESERGAPYPDRTIVEELHDGSLSHWAHHPPVHCSPGWPLLHSPLLTHGVCPNPDGRGAHLVGAY